MAQKPITNCSEELFMIDEKKIKEAERNIPIYLQEHIITKNEKNKEFADFYLKTAKTSLKVADILFALSSDIETKRKLGLEEDFECYMWAVVCSYYSMFYAVNSALATRSIKIGDEIVHKAALNCLIFYFLKTGRLAKHLLEEYEIMQDEVLELIGSEQKILQKMQKRAFELIQSFDFERKKRGTFQYKITIDVKKTVAQTSLNRAKNFLFEMEKLIKREK